MKELNELVDQAKEISSKQWFLNADEEVTAVDNDAGPDDSEEAFIGCAANIQLAKYMTTASPETILAIAEAFRALEQRAEEAETDKRRMDWLCAHCVEVRKPLMYGSHAMFHAQQDSEEWDLPHHTTLREQVDAAMRNIEEQSQ